LDRALLGALLAATFLLRFLLGARSSYWFDELVSVGTYGVWTESLGAALGTLTLHDIHPPLHVVLLYGWMAVFGDSELATRSLSNVCVTLATLFVYLLVRTACSALLALATAGVFSLSFSAMYYGMEARSYGLTLALATGSSLACARLMRRVLDADLRRAWIPATGLTLANAALLLNHYFTAFFLAAQGVVLVLFVMVEVPPRRWIRAFTMLAATSVTSVALFAVLWGQQFAATMKNRSGQTAVAESAFEGPLEIVNRVVEPDLHAPRILLHLVLLGLALVVMAAAVRLFRRGLDDHRKHESWLLVHAAGWFGIPLVMYYGLDQAGGVPHFFHERYLIYVVPAMSTLLVVAGSRVVRVLRPQIPRWIHVALLVGIATAVFAMVLPGTLRAATDDREPYRSLASRVADIVESDPGHRYLVVEADWQVTPKSRYYFERMDRGVNVAVALRPRPDPNAVLHDLQPNSRLIKEHDRLIVMFTHLTAERFAPTISVLDKRYSLRLSELDPDDRGLLIYDLPE